MEKHTLPRAKRRNAALLALAAPGLLLSSLVAPAAPAVAADLPKVADVVRDGSSMANAAASCYEVKQVKPGATNGVYWLQTDLMAAPEQFYCDQETDGGGWVLLGHGRNGWTIDFTGQGSTADVRSNVDSVAGFTPAQLSGTVVAQLLGGTKPQDLADGYRLRRATNQAGSAWQTITFNVARTDRFTWAFGAETPVSNVKMNGSSRSSGVTRSFGSTGWLDSLDGSVVTSEQKGAAYDWGFAQNKTTGGSSADSSFLYSAGGSMVMPMTQIYVRPTLTQASEKFDAVADAGTAVQTQQARAQSGALNTVWGVTTRMGGGNNENYTEAQAFAESDGKMFVGGNFKNVQRDAAGTDLAVQPYLAAFDINTREWVSSIRPTFNGQIKALAALPGNRLAVGGEFNTVNGQSAPGFVVLDSTTGQIDPNWKLTIQNNAAGKPVLVRSINVVGDWLYLGGTFTHFQGETGAQVYSRNAARVNVTTGQPDKTWTPQFNGAVYSLTQEAGSPYVFAAGYFGQDLRAGQGTARALARIDAGAGAQVGNWVWDPSYPARDYLWAWDAVQKGDQVWTGAIEHIFRSYQVDSLKETSSNVTLPGGDFQDVQLQGDVVYAACHCDKWNYSGGRIYQTPWNDSYEANHIDLVGAWDTKTGKMVQDFQPKYKGILTQGIWAMATDSLGNLWTGGDVAKTAKPSGAMQFSGGFAVYAPRDVTPPASPTNGKATRTDGQDTIKWTGAAGAKTYQVLRNDRVVATTEVGTGTVTIPATDGARYFVRAADAEGNLSASTPLITVDNQTPVDPCVANPQLPECQPVDPCIANPQLPQCQPVDPCVANPQLPECQPVDPCVANPQLPECQPVDPCIANPQAPGCVPVDPCVANPQGPGCQPVLKDVNLLPAASTWAWKFSATSSLTWVQPDGKFSSTKNVKAPMGWGSNDLNTKLGWLDQGAFQVKNTFTVADPSQLSEIKLTARADDGIVVWVNGTKVNATRYNSNTFSMFSTATAKVSTAQAVANQVVVPIDKSLLKSGSNTVAVQVLPYSTISGDASFDLKIDAKQLTK